MTGNLEIKTELGFRDITEKLKGKFKDIEKYDVVRRVFLDKEKVQKHSHRGTSKVYYFYKKDYNIRGRVFPFDEVVELYEWHDIIIQNWKDEVNPLNVDAQIYHDFYKGETFTVVVSRISERGNPSFKLFNHITGFINNRGECKDLCDYMHVGSVAFVELDCLTKSKDGKRIHALVKPLEILSV